MSNTIGTHFRLTSFGESHGVAIGGVLDGVPAGLQIDFEAIKREVARRRPGQSHLTTARKEVDEVEWLSGIFEGQTTGAPLAFIIRNKDARSKDYSKLKDTFRPSHADFVYQEKYGLRDYRGGGRSSARETAVRVVAGAIAQQILKKLSISVVSYVHQVEKIKLNHWQLEATKDNVDASIVRCPDKDTSNKIETLIGQVKAEGDSLGGIVRSITKGIPVGLGQPVYDKLHADLGKALLSINAVKGVSFGSGFRAAEMRGSEHNDSFTTEQGKVTTKTNFSGGVQGGISNGASVAIRSSIQTYGHHSKAGRRP